jgi:hypothetical protein
MDVRLLVPRVRRAIDGPTATSSAATSATLNDDQVKNLVADAIAEVLWYCPDWGKTLAVTDDEGGIPTEYEVDPDLSLPEQTVVAAQAALNYFFFEFINKKVSEEISNEAQSWRYQLSANLLTEQFKMLREARDQALETVAIANPTVAIFASFLHARDAETARLIEPFTVEAGGVGGQQLDWRFDG